MEMGGGNQFVANPSGWIEQTKSLYFTELNADKKMSYRVVCEM